MKVVISPNKAHMPFIPYNLLCQIIIDLFMDVYHHLYREEVAGANMRSHTKKIIDVVANRFVVVGQKFVAEDCFNSF